jgi:hypothetical protein
MVAWLKPYASQCGDKLPFGDRSETKIRLPVGQKNKKKTKRLTRLIVTHWRTTRHISIARFHMMTLMLYGKTSLEKK